jgi:beta-glucosidase-like glycosyl hydrolase
LCTSFGYRDKKVVGVFVRFRAPLQKVWGKGCFSTKHFPGHRDTDTDSHKTANGQLFKARLEVMEFYPKKMFEEGLASVMVAHLNVPSLSQTKLSSSISYNVVTNVLQKNWAFRVLFLQML